MGLAQGSHMAVRVQDAESTQVEMNDMDIKWSIVKKGISDMVDMVEAEQRKQQFPTNQCISLYDVVYNICTQKQSSTHSKEAYSTFSNSLQHYIASTVVPALSSSKSDGSLLCEFTRRWANYEHLVRLLIRVFGYLDRFYVVNNDLPSLQEAAYVLFRSMVLNRFKGDVLSVISELIDKHRDGNHIMIRTGFIQNVMNIFVEAGMGAMDFYEENYEATLLKDAVRYYSRKASSSMLQHSSSSYLAQAEGFVEAEKRRVTYFLHPRSGKKLLDVVKKELLCSYHIQFLEPTFFGDLLINDKVDELSRIFRLFSTIPNGLDMVEQVFKQYIIDQGTRLRDETLVTDEYNFRFLRNLTKLHEKSKRTLDVCFMSHERFCKAVDEAFEELCHREIAGEKSVEVLARFCNTLLLGNNLEGVVLENVVSLLAHFSDKDIFNKAYKQWLAKRLLSKECCGYDQERVMLGHMKELCGADYTDDMEDMVDDVEGTKSGFDKYISTRTWSTPQVTLLTTKTWPSYEPSDMKLPWEMMDGLKMFQKFYCEKHPNKTLTWIHSLGTCEMTGYFKAGPLELAVTVPQASVLMLFNSESALTFSYIKSRLNLRSEEAINLLQSLVCCGILKKEPNNETDCFHFNSVFTSKERRIKVCPPLAVDEKGKEIAVKVENLDRNPAIDAAIARIMKRKRTLRHHELLEECVEMLKGKFKPDVRSVKNRVDEMIKKEIIERDENDPQLFSYIA